jgi:hypothetical protein
LRRLKSLGTSGAEPKIELIELAPKKRISC